MLTVLLSTLLIATSWIGVEGRYFHWKIRDPKPAPIFRREFVATPDGRAILTVFAGGYRDVTLNGRPIADEVLMPTPSNFDRRVYGSRYDVTDLLVNGTNVLMVTLGNSIYNCNATGVWMQDTITWRDYPKLRLDITTSNGKTLVETDASWKVWLDGPVRFDSIRNGETYDARKELPPAAFRNGFSADGWHHAVKVHGPGGVETLEKHPPCRIWKRLTMRRLESGLWDSGQNLAGFCELAVRGNPGDEVKVRMFETVESDGTPRLPPAFVESGEFQTDHYILKGNGIERWHPRFVYHGFRYAEVIVTGSAEVLGIDACAVGTDLERIGSIETSHPTLAAIQRNATWSFRSNFVGFPTDCPTREKQGWTGDALVAVETGLFNFDAATSYADWLDGLCDIQRPNGQVPAKSPISANGYNWGYGPAWDAALIKIPETILDFTGDDTLVRRHYAQMVRYVDFAETMLTDGLAEGFGLGDWCDPRNGSGKASPMLVTSAYYYGLLQSMCRFATLMDRNDDHLRFATLAERTKAAFQKRFCRDHGEIGENEATELAVAVAFGLAPYPKLTVELLNLKVQKSSYVYDFGMIGTRWIPQVLSDNGFVDTAFRLVTAEQRLSYWGQLKQGATTLWEHWDGRSSHNHVIFGDVSAWMYRTLGGFRYNSEHPGKMTVRPAFVRGVDSFAATHRGVRSSWVRNKDRISYELNVPDGQSVRLSLPGRPERIVGAGCHRDEIVEIPVQTPAPGWTFLESERPVFECSAVNVVWRLKDWRGRELRCGDWPETGRLEMELLPPGFYRVEGNGIKAFDFCVVRHNPCHAKDSFFALDSALSQCARTNAWDCPWYGGNTYRVVCELMHKLGVSQTRERMCWAKMNPSRDVFDFSYYMRQARLMRENGIVTTGIFGDTPHWAGGMNSKRHLPPNLMDLYRLMTNAVPAFGEIYNAWGFWNEPELSMVPEPIWEYVAAFKAFSLSVHDADPRKPVLAGALADVPQDTWGDGLIQNDFAKYADAFNIHTYYEPVRYPDWHASLRKFLERCGRPDWQVWLTESGTNLEGDSNTDGVRKGLKAHNLEQEMVWAEFYPKSCILHQFGGIYRSWLFMFGCYNERNGRKDWGSMRRDGSVKPIHAAISAITGELGSARLLGEKKIGDGLRAFVYEQPDGTETLAFWSVSEVDTAKSGPVHPKDMLRKSFSVQVAEGEYRLVDMMGTPQTVRTSEGRLDLVAERYVNYLSGLRGLEPDEQASPVGRLIRYEPQKDEDLTVVIRPKLSDDFEITGRKSRAELLKETGLLKIELWNFSDKEKSGCLVTKGATLTGVPECIVLPPWTNVTVVATFVPPKTGPIEGVLEMRFLHGERFSTKATFAYMDRCRFLSGCAAVPMALENPALWKRNDSGQRYSCTYDENEKAVRFDVSWTGETGPWFFPVHTLKMPEESLDGAKMLEFEVKSIQDKVENDYNAAVLMPLYKDGRCIHLHYPAPTFNWELRRVALPDDATDITAFRVGANPRGRKLTFWIRNVRILKANGL